MAMSSLQSLLLFNSLYFNSVKSLKTTTSTTKQPPATTSQNDQQQQDTIANTTTSSSDDASNTPSKPSHIHQNNHHHHSHLPVIDIENKMEYIYDPASIYPYHNQLAQHSSAASFATTPSALASFYLNQQYHQTPGYFSQLSPTNSVNYEPNKFTNSSTSSSHREGSTNSSSCSNNGSTLTPPASSSSSSSTCSSSSSSLELSYSSSKPTSHHHQHSTNYFQPYLNSPIGHHYFSGNNQSVHTSSSTSSASSTPSSYYGNSCPGSGIGQPQFNSTPHINKAKNGDDGNPSSLKAINSVMNKRGDLFITPSLMSIEACQRRKRRQRTQFSKFQLNELEGLFQMTRYPDIYCREDLSARIGIAESRIQVWFKNRRSKIRKDEKLDYRVVMNGVNGSFHKSEDNDDGNESFDEQE